MKTLKRVVPRIIYDQQGKFIGYDLEANEHVMAGDYLFGLAPANHSPLAHDNHSQQLAMPANPARWLDPV